jgi:hypothetical protein
MLSDWVSFLAYPNLFGIKIFVVVVAVAALYPDECYLRRKKTIPNKSSQ